jgi:signal transduction histidine kinase
MLSVKSLSRSAENPAQKAQLPKEKTTQGQRAAQSLRAIEAARQDAVAAERRRLGRDLHDAVTQALFSANLIAEALPQVWERRPEEGRRGLEELRRLIQGALAETRTLLLELRPAAMSGKKLSELLRELSETVTSQAQVALSFSAEGECELPTDVQIALYRIFQEALNNAMKHAKASQVTVRLCCQGAGVVIHISDNGDGFDPGAIGRDHLGVSIMRERALSVGATLELTSRPGEGTHVLVSWQAGARRVTYDGSQPASGADR